MNVDPSLAPWGVLPLIGIVAAAVGVVLVLASLAALRRARPGAFALRAIVGLALLALGALVTGLHGYAALTHEELAARIDVRPTATQRFEATFSFADGQVATYELAGDELYVDAHILKWKPVANVFGLHTLWSLDRVAGRYRAIEQERSAPRTVYPLAPMPVVDLFELRRRFAWLAPLYDADYGSASFVPVAGPAQLELLVSTSGLLIRPGSR